MRISKGSESDACVFRLALFLRFADLLHLRCSFQSRPEVLSRWLDDEFVTVVGGLAQLTGCITLPHPCHLCSFVAHLNKVIALMHDESSVNLMKQGLESELMYSD